MIGLFPKSDGQSELQHRYGYYIDKTLYNQAVDLFAESPDANVKVHFHGGIALLCLNY